MSELSQTPAIEINAQGHISIQRPSLMGILNVTPDSFSDGGKYASTEEVVERALQFSEWGAQILDIGGESSRPGAQPVPLESELERVIPVIKKIRKHSDTLISIDTTKAEVARQALEAGANLINDISACQQEPQMWDVAKNVPLILMHMRGEPRTMQNEVYYEDVLAELVSFFRERIDTAKAKGIDEAQLILDPGIGFGKQLEHNLILLKKIETFQQFNRPLLIGASRKSLLGKILNNPVDKRIMGDAAITAYCFFQGVSLIRVHDVFEMQQVLDVLSAIERTLSS